MDKRILSFFDFLEENKNKVPPPIVNFYKNPGEYTEQVFGNFTGTGDKDYKAKKVDTPEPLKFFLPILEKLSIKVVQTYEYVYSRWKGSVAVDYITFAETSRNRGVKLQLVHNNNTLRIHTGNTFRDISKQTIRTAFSNTTALLRLKKNYTPLTPEEQSYLNNLPKGKASDIVKDPKSPTVTFSYGKIKRSGRGAEGKPEDLYKYLSVTTESNIQALGKMLGITWEKMYIYNLKDEAMVAVFGKDEKGREFMFDKYGTGQASQTYIRLGTKVAQVSKVLAGNIPDEFR